MVENFPIVFRLKITDEINYTNDDDMKLHLAGKGLDFNNDSKVPFAHYSGEDNVKLRCWMSDEISITKQFLVKPSGLKYSSIEFWGKLSNGNISVYDENRKNLVVI